MIYLLSQLHFYPTSSSWQRLEGKGKEKVKRLLRREIITLGIEFDLRRRGRGAQIIDLYDAPQE